MKAKTREDSGRLKPQAGPWDIRRCAERPRERLFRLGAEALLDSELLAVVLGCGVRGRPVAQIASGLLRTTGGLKALGQHYPQELCALSGLGPARAAQVVAALELGRRAQRPVELRPRLRCAAEIYGYLGSTLRGLRREVFHVLSFNSRNILLADARVAEGTLNQCPVDPREVFCSALSAHATAIVLAHNHPSGDPEPSQMDRELTLQLVQGGRILGIRVLDHIVIGDSGYVSLLDRGLMPREFEEKVYVDRKAGSVGPPASEGAARDD